MYAPNNDIHSTSAYAFFDKSHALKNLRLKLENLASSRLIAYLTTTKHAIQEH